MSKVSIITPAYNAAAFIEDTIKSVQEQTYTDWEMIIVDDCSSDETYKIAECCAEQDNRIRVTKNEKNSGVAYTRNRALDMASGDYIAFLDSDDLWLPQKLETQIAFMEEGNYALTYTAYQKFNSKTGQLGKIIKAPKKMKACSIYGNTIIGCLTVVVNRKIVGEFHMPLIKHMEDNCTWQEILSRGYVAYGINDVLSLYREGNISLTQSKKSATKQQWQIYRKFYEFSLMKSMFYFCCYVINAVKKHYL